MKNNIYPTLKTKYINDMNPEHPWDIYPRPSMKRDSYFSLCGIWDFAQISNDSIPENFTEKILVPFPPESFLSKIERKVGKNDRLIYRRFFTLPDGFIKDRVVLHFGAVDQECTVFINGRQAGDTHIGGYIPFSYDITDLLIREQNEIYVIAKDSLSKKYPYGKQKNKRGGMWYTPVSGIWQQVWLESVPDEYIESIKITPTTKNVKIQVYSKAETKKITLLECGEVFEFTEDSLEIEIENPILWSPENPHLYNFKLETEKDCVESYFALREISIKEIKGIKRMCLNGEPYFFSALLDQGYFPDGIFLPATPQGFEDDILFSKKLGFNTLRKHIKIEPEIFYYLCDKHGMIIFQDMVNNSNYSFFLDTALPTIGFKKMKPTLRNKNQKTQKEFYKAMIETSELLYNHPSVCLYTIFNEGWGQFPLKCINLYEKLKEMNQELRFIDTSSGWFSGDKTDLDSRHVYFKFPTIEKKSDKPIFLSEFGGYSLRIDGHLFGSKNYGYALYENEQSFSDAVYELFTAGLLPLIDKGLSAIVYTQLSDVEDETNGLITYDRKYIKIDEKKIKEANELLKEKLEHSVKSD